MKTGADTLEQLQAQLNQKNELVAALTAQLEKTATQLDRLTRAGGERLNSNAHSPPPGALNPEVAHRLTAALEEWEVFQPVNHLERIESGIEQILDLLSRQPAHPQVHAAHEQKLDQEDFWAATKARILGDSPQESNTSSGAGFTPSEAARDESLEDLFQVAGATPSPPTPVSPMSGMDELWEGISSRDTYINYLTTRLRMVESRKFVPVNWNLLAEAPENYRDRLKAMEDLLKDHLRQSEVSLSLERAVLARERAKLAQVKQNLEAQIRKLAFPVQPQDTQPLPPEPADSSDNIPAVPESRWKRIFTR